ncbi:MAG: AIR synthase related protein, partial [Burkholderiales bacterium]
MSPHDDWFREIVSSVISEFEIIRRYFTSESGGALLGVGDDAALVAVSPGMELAVSTDMLLEGRHFFANADPRQLGHKALAVNLSDMAAMGAEPRWLTLALALPKADEHWLEAFSRGFSELAHAHQVELIGGDTCRGALT